MMECSNCGTPVPDTGGFCPRCGRPTATPSISDLPEAVNWTVIRHQRYAELLALAKSAAGIDLIMEEFGTFEDETAQVLNVFKSDGTPAFSFASGDRKPLFQNGTWTPIQIRTSHPELVAAANRLARDYQAKTREVARVVVPQ